MKEEEVAYIGGVVDSIANLRVIVKERESNNIGYSAESIVEIHRSGSQDVVLGMIDEYANSVGVFPNVYDIDTTTKLQIAGVDDIYNFIEPLEEWMIQQHEMVEIFLGEILPAIEAGEHLEKEGFIDLLESRDELYEMDNTISRWNHTATDLKQKWSNELAK